jgi:hypothetical protein
MGPFGARMVCMTHVLENAIAEVAKLPAEEQDRIGQWILAESADERSWNEQFQTSQDILADLADEALEQDARGEATELDPRKQ